LRRPARRGRRAGARLATAGVGGPPQEVLGLAGPSEHEDVGADVVFVAYPHAHLIAPRERPAGGLGFDGLRRVVRPCVFAGDGPLGVALAAERRDHIQQAGAQLGEPPQTDVDDRRSAGALASIGDGASAGFFRSFFLRVHDVGPCGDQVDHERTEDRQQDDEADALVPLRGRRSVAFIETEIELMGMDASIGLPASGRASWSRFRAHATSSASGRMHSIHRHACGDQAAVS
jgi:hypothetical protein